MLFLSKVEVKSCLAHLLCESLTVLTPFSGITKGDAVCEFWAHFGKRSAIVFGKGVIKMAIWVSLRGLLGLSNLDRFLPAEIYPVHHISFS